MHGFKIHPNLEFFHAVIYVVYVQCIVHAVHMFVIHVIITTLLYVCQHQLSCNNSTK